MRLSRNSKGTKVAKIITDQPPLSDSVLTSK